MRTGREPRRQVRRRHAQRALGAALVVAGLLVVSPIGEALAAPVDPSTTSTAPTTDPAAATSAPATTSPASTADATTTTPPATTAASTSSTTVGPRPTTTTTSPTTTSPATTSTTVAPLAVSGILQAPNPFDADHGFTLLARRDAQLQGGATVGAVAVGGDLRFGPYNVTPKPAAVLDQIPVGLLIGGGVTTKDSSERLTVGANGRVLVGDLAALTTVPVGRGVAVVPAGGTVDVNPQIRTSGPQAVDAVASPGTFDAAFHGVFADLAQRSRSLAATASDAVVTDPDGKPIADQTGVDVQVAAPDGDGPVFWSVTSDDLGRAGAVTLVTTPTAARPLVITVDGAGAPVRFDTNVSVAAAGRPYVLWNVVDAPSVVVTRPLPGSLLAPAAAVRIDDDVTGAVIADTVTQTGGTVGTTPFAAELPKTAVSPDPSAPAAADPSTTDPAALPQVVPPATGNNAVITVKVGGDRVSTSAVAGLAGVTLQLYDGTSAPSTPVTDSFATCVSDVDGDCNFIVPNTQANGANRDRRFWVVRTTSSAGWFGLNTLVTGASPPFASTPYQFRTGDQLRAGNTYASSGPNATFMLSTGNTNPTASGGIWQTSRNNPAFPAKCGINVALVLDLSGSVAPALASLKTAAKTFTNSLVGTPSQLSLFTFSSTAPANTTNNQNRPLTAVSTQAGADTVNGWIDGLSASGGTNWDRGIYQVAQSSNHFDVAIVITDGNPTFYGNQEGPGNYTRFREVENGIFSANAVKAEATRIVAVGVGDGVSGAPNNLISISGPTANSDYYQATDYAQAGVALRALALGACQGSVSVIKQVVPSTAPPGSTTGAAPAGGWTFAASTTASGVGISPPSGATANGSGALSFNLSFPGGTTTAPVTVAETQQAGYTLVPVGGFNATCTRLDTNAALTVTNSGAAGFSVTAATAYPVSCTMYNRAPSPGATVVVDKTWVINGQSFAQGQQPPDFQAALTIGGSPQDWGVVRTGFQQGNTTVLNETVQLSRLQCTLVSSRVTLANGTTVDNALPYTATLAAGANSYTMTNTVSCISRLTLVKQVNGSAAPTVWTLTATAPSGALPGPSGTTGVTARCSLDVGAGEGRAPGPRHQSGWSRRAARRAPSRWR